MRDVDEKLHGFFMSLKKYDNDAKKETEFAKKRKHTHVNTYSYEYAF